MSEKEKQNSLFFKQRYVSDWGIYLFRWIKEVGNFPLLKTYSFLYNFQCLGKSDDV
jgi:hypothetical protein